MGKLEIMFNDNIINELVDMFVANKTDNERFKFLDQMYRFESDVARQIIFFGKSIEKAKEDTEYAHTWDDKKMLNKLKKK